MCRAVWSNESLSPNCVDQGNFCFCFSLTKFSTLERQNFLSKFKKFKATEKNHDKNDQIHSITCSFKYNKKALGNMAVLSFRLDPSVYILYVFCFVIKKDVQRQHVKIQLMNHDGVQQLNIHVYLIMDMMYIQLIIGCIVMIEHQFNLQVTYIYMYPYKPQNRTFFRKFWNPKIRDTQTVKIIKLGNIILFNPVITIFCISNFHIFPIFVIYRILGP